MRRTRVLPVHPVDRLSAEVLAALARVRKQILNEPQNFHMISSWHQCIAGYLIRDAGQPVPNMGAYVRAAEILGNDHAASSLFWPEAWPPWYASRHKHVKTRAEEARLAAALLKRVIAEGGVWW